MNIEKHIIAATAEVFETMVMLEVAPGAPLAEKITSFCDSISGMLGFSGDLKGMLNIHCPRSVALAITGSLLGLEVDEINEDVKDAIGEIANMVAGSIKTGLATEGKNLELSIPTTIAGKSYAINTLAEAERVVVPFDSAGSRFLVELRFKTIS